MSLRRIYRKPNDQNRSVFSYIFLIRMAPIMIDTREIYS